MLISQTPLRISLVGGGTDFPDFYLKYGGAVISTTINKYIYVIIKERFDNKIGCYYHNSETVNEINEIRHDLIRETAIFTGMKNGFDITILSDAPADGSGLGSSSSMTVGLLNAFYNYQNKSISQNELAKFACEIEINILNKPIGKQDQYIAAFGGFNHIEFSKNNEINVNKINLNNSQIRNIDESLLLYFTNVTRKAGSILYEQKNNIQKNTDLLINMNMLTNELLTKLTLDGDIEAIGNIINRSWILKQKFADKIMNEEIEALWRLSMGNGASGGKISGAGGGGFLLIFVKKSLQDQLRKALNNYFEFPFMFEQSGSKIIFNQSRQLIK